MINFSLLCFGKNRYTKAEKSFFILIVILLILFKFWRSLNLTSKKSLSIVLGWSLGNWSVFHMKWISSCLFLIISDSLSKLTKSTKLISVNLSSTWLEFEKFDSAMGGKLIPIKIPKKKIIVNDAIIINFKRLFIKILFFHAFKICYLI